MQLEECFNVLALDDFLLKGTRIGMEVVLQKFSQTPSVVAVQFLVPLQLVLFIFLATQPFSDNFTELLPI